MLIFLQPIDKINREKPYFILINNKIKSELTKTNFYKKKHII
jgi:hypothetical protein